MKLVFENKQKLTTDPVVTVGVCLKDCEAYVRGMIKSVLNQDFPHKLMEVIIVDDGSKDKTLSRVIDAISDSDIHAMVFSGEWIGLGRARNTVIQHSNGRYIVWVDGDLILRNNYVRKQVEFMQNNPTVGVAKGTCGIFVGQNLVGFLEDVAYFAFCFRNRGIGTKVLGTGGSIYRSEAIKKVGGFDNCFSGAGEDNDVESRIRYAGWSLYMRTSGVFFEKRRRTWPSLWKECFWHGYGGSQFYRKNRRVFSLYEVNPLAGLFAGVLYSCTAYKFIQRKIVFLLPVQYAFKRIAWCFGFIKGQAIRHAEGDNRR